MTDRQRELDGPLLIVDNSASGRNGLDYLSEWAELASGIDIARSNECSHIIIGRHEDQRVAKRPTAEPDRAAKQRRGVSETSDSSGVVG
jgi:hypothetical protein